MNDFQCTLLAKARVLIESGIEQFICCSLDQVYGRRSGPGTLEEYRLFVELKEKIQDAILGKHTVENYLYFIYGFRYERLEEGRRDFWDDQLTNAEKCIYFPREEYTNLVRNVRLAWIDRMLERNEVK